MRSTTRALAVIASLAAGLAFAEGAVDKKVERTWKAKCASCHGADGKGQTEQGLKMKVQDMSTAAWQKEVTDERAKKAINEGIKIEKDGVKQEMEPYKDALKPDQIDGLVAYLRTLGPKK